MTFDPFGDFESRGYQRNRTGEKDLAVVRRLEHAAFTTGLDEAIAELTKSRTLTYEHVLSTHRTLFDAVYPWAGQDRLVTAPSLAVIRGAVQFAHPNDIRAAVDHALRNGQNTARMKSKPGEIMGYLACGHPFLDGNGRAIMVVHGVLAQRAGIHIDWSKTDKDVYLNALAREVEEPHKGHLDAYLEPLIRTSSTGDQIASAVRGAPGLDGALKETDRILGPTDAPEVKARYEAFNLRRKQP